MKSYQDILQNIQTFQELGKTIAAANFVLQEYSLNHANFKNFELTEKAKPEFILMTTEGVFGEKQIIKIPENTFEFEFKLMLNLIAHEMIHVGQKEIGNFVEDRNEREWQAYYEMLFHTVYPQIPDLPKHQQLFFAKRALDYYKKMEQNSALQIKYALQKKEVDNLVALLD